MGRIDHTYGTGQPLLAEVLVDGTWCYAEIAMWTKHEDGSITGWARWSAGAGENRIGTFPIDQLRPVDEHDGRPLDPATVWPWTLTQKPTDS